MANLALRDVSKSYGEHPAVRGLTLDVADGELLVLLGPSGCGKSTTLRLIAGLESADQGSIAIGGRDVTAAAAAERDVAMVFQSYALFPHMSVEENLAFGLAARRTPAAQIAAAVSDVAETLGLTPLLARKPRQLSGGERQRVALGRAMVRRPSVFLMDEPLSNLDAQLRVATRAEIQRLQARLATTTVYVTHDQNEALSIGHRVGILDGGVLAQVGAPVEVYDRPASAFIAGFLGNPPMNLPPVSCDGNVARWNGGEAAVAGAPAADAVTLGVRPEHVHIDGSRWAPPIPAGVPAFDATVDLIESAGDQNLIFLIAGDASLVARVEPALRPAPGARVRAWLDPSRLHIFDPATGAALWHAS